MNIPALIAKLTALSKVAPDADLVIVDHTGAIASVASVKMETNVDDATNAVSSLITIGTAPVA